MLAYVAGESGLATMGATVAVAVVLFTRAKVWQVSVREAVPAVSEPRPGVVLV